MCSITNQIWDNVYYPFTFHFLLRFILYPRVIDFDLLCLRTPLFIHIYLILITLNWVECAIGVWVEWLIWAHSWMCNLAEMGFPFHRTNLGHPSKWPFHRTHLGNPISQNPFRPFRITYLKRPLCCQLPSL